MRTNNNSSADARCLLPLASYTIEPPKRSREQRLPRFRCYELHNCPISRCRRVTAIPINATPSHSRYTVLALYRRQRFVCWTHGFGRCLQCESKGCIRTHFGHSEKELWYISRQMALLYGYAGRIIGRDTYFWGCLGRDCADTCPRYRHQRTAAQCA